MDDIVDSLQRTVQGFCRRIVDKVPVDVEMLILFFYAKPMKMKVKELRSESFKTILICPVHGNWNYVKKRIFGDDDPYEDHIEHVDNKGNTKKVGGEEWDAFEWDEEEDHFRKALNLDLLSKDLIEGLQRDLADLRHRLQQADLQYDSV